MKQEYGPCKQVEEIRPVESQIIMAKIQELNALVQDTRDLVVMKLKPVSIEEPKNQVEVTALIPIDVRSPLFLAYAEPLQIMHNRIIQIRELLYKCQI